MNSNWPKTYAFIFARGGSKGIPGKNLKLLGGKPLVAHSIMAAKSCARIDKIFLSTDDEKIAAVAENYGAEIIERPASLATDESPEWLSWQHAVNYIENRGDAFDVFLSLPATAPLRNQQDIDNCLAGLTDDVDIVITMTESNRSPWFNMVKIEDGLVELLISGKNYQRRQEAPPAFDMTTVAYVTRPGCIKSYDSIFACKVKGIEVPKQRAIDIDTEEDFLIATAIYNESQSKCC